MIKVHATVAASALALTFASGALAQEDAAPATTVVATSMATVVDGSFTVDGQKTVISPQLPANGSAPPAYNVTTTKASYNHTTSLPYYTTLTIKTGKLTDTAASAGQQGTTATATASSSISAASATIINPYITGNIVGVSATTVASNASFTTTTGAAPTDSGSVNLVGLKVDLTALGYGVRTYSGKPAANKVLWKSPDGSVRIYLNRQITTMQAVAGTSTMVPVKLEVDAVDVHLTDAKLTVGGLTVTASGDLRIGVSQAGS